MNKTFLNYFVDIGIAISFFTCFITGLLKWHGIINIIGLELYRAVSSRSLSSIHDWSGVVVGVLIIVHLILHFTWIKSVTKNIFTRKSKE